MPLIARWPRVIPPGVRSMALTQNIDFGPTFLEAAGVDVPPDMQGRSLMSLLKNETASQWRRSLYYHYYEKGEHNVPRHYGVRTPHYKLIHYYDNNEWELFDLQKDPQEMRSVYADPTYASIRERLYSELGRLQKEYQVPGIQ